MKSFNQVSLTGTLFQNTIALCIVVMDTEHEMLINFFFFCGVSIYFTSVDFLTFYVKNAPIGESVFCARYL